MVVERVTTGTGGFSWDSGKALLPGPLSLCSTPSGLVIFVTHNHLRFEELLRRLPSVHLQHHFTASASIEKALLVREGPLIRRPDPKDSGEDNLSATIVFYPSSASIFTISNNHLRLATSCLAWSDVDKQDSIVYCSSFMSYISLLKILPFIASEPLLSRPPSSSEEKTSPPFPFPMERDDSSASLPSVCFRFPIGLLSCGAVSTGPEDATESISVSLVDEVWTSTSHYVTIIQLSDVVVKALSTHSSIVLNSLSSSVEDLSCLVYLCVVFSAYGQRGWIIPSFYCMEEV
uniref:Uncharacterized protein n=1 Tax=Brassica oleracea TaxID=3712 RepID=A0A3P6FSE2_BRAOL|nr:unnamed protein product [Brassica oleracea]